MLPFQRSHSSRCLGEWRSRGPRIEGLVRRALCVLTAWWVSRSDWTSLGWGKGWVDLGSGLHSIGFPLPAHCPTSLSPARFSVWLAYDIMILALNPSRAEPIQHGLHKTLQSPRSAFCLSLCTIRFLYSPVAIVCE